jgi:hypothetical protein
MLGVLSVFSIADQTQLLPRMIFDLFEVPNNVKSKPWMAWIVFGTAAATRFLARLSLCSLTRNVTRIILQQLRGMLLFNSPIALARDNTGETDIR